MKKKVFVIVLSLLVVFCFIAIEAIAQNGICEDPNLDSDGDGTVDCEDECPFDPNKITPGDCGCGETEILGCGICEDPNLDSDGDGTADCYDQCPVDPNKIAPGECGCREPEIPWCTCEDLTDTDGDGTPDFCGDECPYDPNKIEEGMCGCGKSEDPNIDTDGDKIPDCEDECHTDPNKIDPGECGCTKPEIEGCIFCEDPFMDTDGDGILDCDEECPADPDKIDPGECGCGKPEDFTTDTDKDGTVDCDDECPTDPNKIDPEICGCGEIEIPGCGMCEDIITDTDGDGTIDCLDECPYDPNKIEEGLCGCGKAEDDEKDTDGDGIPDCDEECHTDPNKIDPGICGCGKPEDPNDTDGDGTPDCVDECPTDPNKTVPGICGCDIADADADQDGVPICNDCDDTDITIYPGAPEICDNKDNDCDGIVDEGLVRECSNECGEGTETCENGEWVNCTTQLGHEEICDGIDNDCDGRVDEPGAIGCKPFYRDDDRDGYGLTEDSLCLCPKDPNERDPNYISYTAIKGGDCDDTDPSVYPRLVRIAIVKGDPGETDVKVPIRISDASGIAGGDIILTYDPNVLIAQDLITTPLLNGFFIDYSINQDGGKIILYMARHREIPSGQGILMVISFDVSEYAQEGTLVPIVFENLTIYDENAKPVCVEPIDGAFNITTCTKGDVDWNGEITAADAILVLKIAVGKHIPDEYQLCAVDVNGDGEINSADAILVLKAVVRKITIFLLEPDYGIAGSTINIIGWNFGNNQGGSAIYFGDIPAAAISWMDREIVTTVPSGIPTGAVDVTIVNENGTTSNNREFTVGQENLRLRDLSPMFRAGESPKIISIPTGIIAEPCEKITIPVDIDDAAGIAGMDLVLAFDPLILTPVKAECTDLTDGFFLVSGVAKDGRLRISGAIDTGILSGSGAIINLIFEVSSNVRESGSIEIVIEDIRLFDEKANPIEILGHQNGEILVSGEDPKSSIPDRTNKTIYNTYWKQLSLYRYYPSYFYNFSQVSDWTNLWTSLFGVNYYYPNNGFSYILNQGYPWMQDYYDYYPHPWNVQKVYPDISWFRVW